MRKQTKLRRPQYLPREDDVQRLRNFMVTQINQILEEEEIDEDGFILLRNLLCCRLTMFNAR